MPVDQGEKLFDCDGEELNQDDKENGDPANEGNNHRQKINKPPLQRLFY